MLQNQSPPVLSPENMETHSTLFFFNELFDVNRGAVAICKRFASPVTSGNTVIKPFGGEEGDSWGHFKDINLFPLFKGAGGRAAFPLWIPPAPLLRAVCNHPEGWFHSHSRKLYIVICKFNQDYINIWKFESTSLRKTILQYRPTTQRLAACNNKLQENTDAVVLACAYLRPL